MKLTWFLVLFFTLQMSASVWSQTMSVKLKNSTLQELFLHIEKSSNYRFFYNNDEVDVNLRVSVSAEEKTVGKILEAAFEGMPYSFRELENKMILIEKSGVPSKFNTSSQQGKSVYGKVTDSSGSPLPGVSVVIKGTTNGYITDTEGNYSLSEIPVNAVLQFSFVGMKMQEIVVGDRTTILVTLVEESIGIEEVVAVGYGTQKKEVVTGAITTVKSKDVSVSPSSRLTDGLAGRMSGVIINSRGGQPGRENTEIFIRGKSTTKYAAPLYVIDGVVRDYNGLDRLNSNEIQSITVLKDASGAIYGAQAANGVILITTKRGAIGKPTIDFSYDHGFAQPTRNPSLADSYNFADKVNLSLTIRGLPAKYTQEELQKFKDGSDPINYPNTSWWDLIIRDQKHQDKANVSISGGTDDLKYFVSAGMLNQGTPFVESFTYNKQYNVRANIDAKITNNLKVSFDLAGRLDDILSNKVNFAHIDLGFPWQLPVFPNGLYGEGRTGENAVIMAREKEYSYLSTDGGVITSTLSAVYTIPGIKGLSLAASYSYDYNKQYSKDYWGVTYWNSYDKTTDTYTPRMVSKTATPKLDATFNQGVSNTGNIRLAYKNTFFEKHTIDGFLGYEENTTHADLLTAGRQQFLSGSIHELFAGTADKNFQTNNGSAAETARQNYFGRALYDYRNKYMLQFHFRYDGSQNFPSEKRFGFFPGISGGWTISKETFMENVTVLDKLKLRASWGKMGNDRVGAFQYLTAYTYGNNYVLNGSTAQGLVQSGVPNPNITWEVANTTDFGLESSFWNGLLSLDMDYFYTKRSNILAKRDASVPYYTGLVLPDENIGIVDNQGVEFMLSHNKEINKDLKYSVSGNFTYAKSNVISIDEVPMQESYQKAEGMPVGSPLLYEVTGIFNDQADIDSYPHLAGTVPGDLIRKDANKDGVINSFDQVRQELTPTPQIVYGLNLKLDYKQFELGVMFQGQARSRVGGLTTIPYDPLGWGNFNTYLLDDAWTPENPDGTKPRPGLNNANGYNGTTFRIFSGDFLRLKNLELAYNLPKSLLTKVNVQACRIYLTGYNLLSIDAFRKMGIDPELNITGNGGNVPVDRIINVGINLTF